MEEDVVDVAVVGYGPVGMVTAALLGRRLMEASLINDAPTVTGKSLFDHFRDAAETPGQEVIVSADRDLGDVATELRHREWMREVRLAPHHRWLVRTKRAWPPARPPTR